MAWASFVLLADWAVCTALYLATGDQFMWPVLAAFDYTAALLLVAVLPSRWGAVLATSYVLEGMAHVAFGLSIQGTLQKYTYWWALHDIAWGQAWTVLAWGVWTGGKKLRSYRDHRERLAASPLGALRRGDGGDTGR